MKKSGPVKPAAKSRTRPRRTPAAGVKRRTSAKRQAAVRSPAALAISRRLLQSIYDTIPDAIISTDRELNIVSCNQSVTRVLGYSPEELTGKNYQILIPKFLREDASQQARLGELVTKGYFEEEDFSFQRKNGEVFRANFSVAMVKDERGRPLGAVGAIRDISERRRAEEALRESEERYRNLVETSPDAITLTNLEGKVVTLNQRALALYGLSRFEEAIGQNSFEYIAPKERARAAADLQKTLTSQGAQRNVFTMVRRDGSSFEGEVYASVLRDEEGKPRGLVAVTRDITERKRMEQQVQDALAFNQMILDASPIGILTYDPSGQCTSANAAASKITGGTMAQLLAQNFRSLEIWQQQGLLSAAEEALASQRLTRREFHSVSSFGKEAWQEVHFVPFLVENQKHLLLLMTDIKDRKAAEAALRESESRYRSLVENSLLGVGLSQGNQVLYANPALLQMYGYEDLEEFRRIPLLENVAPASRAMIRERQEQVRKSLPVSTTFEYEILRRDGEHRTLQALSSHLRSGGETVTQTTFVDITERKRAEAALRESETRHREIFESIQEFILVHDLEGTITSANPQVKQTMGFKTDRLVGKKLAGLIEENLSPQLLENWKEVWRKVRAEVQKPGDLFREEVFIPIASGEVRAFAFIYSGIFREGRLVGYLHIGRDITERKRAEQALREGEERYRRLMETSPDAIIMTDLTGNILMINQQALKLYRASGLAEMIGRNAFSFIAPEDQAQAQENQIRALASGHVASAEYRLFRADGSSYQGELNVSLLKDAAGQPLGFIGVLRDISERKQAEQALQESEKRYRTLFDDSPISLWEEDFSRVKAYLDQLQQQGIQDLAQYFQEHPDEVVHCATMVRLVDVNKATLALFQAQSKQDLLRGLARTFKQENFDSFMKQLLSVGEGRTSFDAEMVNQTLTGEKKNVMMHWVVAPGYEATFARVLVSIIDLTERKRLEAQILHAQKLESLGILAGGIAHDFNNLLVSILGHAGLALGRSGKDSPSRKNLEQIEFAARRAADLTKQMLAYSGRGTFEVKPLNLSKLVEEMAHLLEVAISKRVRVAYHFASALPAIAADATQVRQVVMNLISNASEAIGDADGAITVVTGVMPADRAYLSETYLNEELAEGRYVYLEVSDTGCGLDKETQAKIFDPFFTTKFPGRGLGLASVLGIVRGHRGAIKVYSEVGHGTTFKVLFPSSAEPAQESAPAEVSLEGWRGQGTILVVDDEETVREATRAMLEEFGFTTLLAAEGREGIELLRGHAGEIAAVLLDLTMVGLSGKETLEQMLQIQPEVRIILTSGYNELEVTRRFAGQGHASFIQKPYQPSELIRKLREVLEDKKDKTNR